MGRSLQVQEQYQQKAKKAVISLGLTQKSIATRLNCSRQPVSKFFNCKPVSNELFVSICEILKLDWEEITGLKTNRVDNTPLTEKPETEVEIDRLVTRLREQVKADIENRCGTMRIFDMNKPIALGKIYTKVNILEKTSRSRRKEIAELISICTSEELERFNFGQVTKEKIPGKKAVENHNKLLILGKPGAGKTTFLKHLAIQCNQNEFQGDLVPFFVTLKDFAETEDKPNLLTYLSNYIESENSQNLQQILKHNRALILLDGLDEVLNTDSNRVIKEIESLTNSYPENQYVMTCRIAAREYTFEKFTEVEIADFDWKQITNFAHNWFKDKPIKPETFLERLKQDKPIKELVANPLLLTLLCISFEELGDFPANRKELYEEGLNALLRKWDSSRGKQRDKVYKTLSIAKKEDLLSNIAWKTFAPGNYFFKIDAAKRYISEYIRNLPGANLDDEALQGDSGIVLKNIEAQHGLLVERARNIYSFSHLTFQEYFTAREIILVRQSDEKALAELVSHLFDKRWREVFLLAVAMSPNAEKLVLLMKSKIDDLLGEDDDLQQYLQWLNNKTQAANFQFLTEDIKTIQKIYDFYTNKSLTLARIFYLGLDLEFNLNRHLYRNLYRNLTPKLNLSLNLNNNLYFNLYTKRIFGFNFSLNQNRNLYLELAKECDPKLYEVLLKLKAQLPYEEVTSGKEFEDFKIWWQENGEAWIKDFRNAMITYRNIGHDWQFSNEQKDLLKQYYLATKLLTECLHQDCYVSPEVRQEIEETLLLPVGDKLDKGDKEYKGDKEDKEDKVEID